MMTDEEKQIAQELVDAAQAAADQTHSEALKRAFSALAKFARLVVDDADEEKTNPGA